MITEATDVRLAALRMEPKERKDQKDLKDLRVGSTIIF